MTSAFAGPKVYSGARCTFTAVSENEGQTRTSGFLKNDTGVSQNVVCPFVTDLYGNYESVYIVASSRVDDDTCTFFEYDFDGSASNWWPHHDVSQFVDAGSNSEDGINKIEWFTGPNYGVGAAATTRLVECKLPAGSVIYTYYLDEV
jgi:hypothetical protein